MFDALFYLSIIRLIQYPVYINNIFDKPDYLFVDTEGGAHEEAPPDSVFTF